jgi:PAS domain S-box-containing protein
VAAVALGAVCQTVVNVYSARSGNPAVGALHLVPALVVVVASFLVLQAAWSAYESAQISSREAKQLRGKLAGVSTVSDEVVWEMAPDGCLTSLSDKIMELLGYDAAALIGTNVFDLVHPDEARRAVGLIGKALAEGTGWRDETFRLLHAEGEYRWVHTNGVAHVREDGHVLGFVATSRLADEDAERRNHLEIERQVAGVLRQRSLSTVFQPIVSVKTGHVVGVEALSRFLSAPAQGPDRWFRDADRVGRGVELELLALKTAAAAAQHLPTHLYVSMNASPAALLSDAMAEFLRTTDLGLERLVLEITEHVSVGDYADLVALRERLRGLKVRLAVDDAGAGFASFKHILRLQPDIIKLDREIISGIDQDPSQRALAAAIVMFAGEMKCTIVAEGIETTGEMAAVTALGVDGAQGYLLGHPTGIPADWREWQPPTPGLRAPVGTKTSSVRAARA